MVMFDMYVMFLTSIFENVKNAILSVGEGIWAFYGALFDFISGKTAAVGAAVGGVLGYLQDIMGAVISSVKGFLNKYLIGVLNSVLTYELPLIGSIKSITGIQEIPMLAKGGVVNSATPAIIGEDGPEAVIPLRPEAVSAVMPSLAEVRIAAEDVQVLGKLNQQGTATLNATLNRMANILLAIEDKLGNAGEAPFGRLI
jgi:hypothetical protein